MRDHVEHNRALVPARLKRLVHAAVGDRAGAAGLDAELAARSIQALAEEAGRRVLTDPARFPPERDEAFVHGVMARLRGEPTR